ncbi:ATP-binding protein [Sphingomonas sp. BGYR3]|uniref:hybrid sensor histidine kinase/response regulator n=1 Tax=Sphingomonas sp. BGYR3 TaxID=2975483 RepID=UPI0021A6D7B7|nr:ATP-binding protein [Sphingomonas sp. BGYR3]MDG5487636.1 ATP-binding protein [Sphingomonas sp. BGYR3]
MASSPVRSADSLPAPAGPVPAVLAAVAVLVAAGLILWFVRDPRFAAGFAAVALVAVACAALIARRSAAPVSDADAVEPDWAMARALADALDDPAAVTDRAGRLVFVNAAYAERFPALPAPPLMPMNDQDIASLTMAARTAWTGGSGQADDLILDGLPVTARITRGGAQGLIWRFTLSDEATRLSALPDLLSGVLGDRLGRAGVMAVLVQGDGRMVAASRAFRQRALGDAAAPVAGRDMTPLIAPVDDDVSRFRLSREGEGGGLLRFFQVPLDDADHPDDETPILLAMVDEEDRPGPDFTHADAGSWLESMIELLPGGVALLDEQGRLACVNHGFYRATRTTAATRPTWPGDLVVREDKAALADAIHRVARPGSRATDLPVRMRDRPDEPVSLRITSLGTIARGRVMLAFKDTGEEQELKRQVAQAIKMQAVGQLAGGVAHDFNNILTAILGHCDLMLMRHDPGDGDHDDIQQIRSNANRAASLTRQLLAFSRQQTLRPQVLQLPDVISEVSALLKRLLGETVDLVVQHGRGLGPVRADPGQLEQVVVNLAVNARDAMLAKHPNGGGVLRIETLSVTAADIRRRGDGVLPEGDYTALRVSDTGSGIPPEIQAKIFEPFFTTKETGKGTGLGLSTVYGIVKQSGGYIFADSEPGHGSTFTIYLPVHRATAPTARPVRGPSAPAARAEGATAPPDLWGTGTILLVEDEDMVRAVAERALSRQGYTVLTAENGEVAMQMLGDGLRPDLLITDVVMPVMDGPTLVGHVREAFPAMPILFMSGYAEEQARKQITIDNVAFLPKPFSVQQLAQAARDVMTAQ